MIKLLDRLRRAERPAAGRKKINLALDSSFKKLTAASKLNSDYDFFEMLKKGGARAARNFLGAHFDDLGVRSTVDLAAEAKAEWA